MAKALPSLDSEQRLYAADKNYDGNEGVSGFAQSIPHIRNDHETIADTPCFISFAEKIAFILRLNKTAKKYYDEAIRIFQEIPKKPNFENRKTNHLIELRDCILSRMDPLKKQALFGVVESMCAFFEESDNINKSALILLENYFPEDGLKSSFTSEQQAFIAITALSAAIENESWDFFGFKKIQEPEYYWLPPSAAYE